MNQLNPNKNLWKSNSSEPIALEIVKTSPSLLEPEDLLPYLLTYLLHAEESFLRS